MKLPLIIASNPTLILTPTELSISILQLQFFPNLTLSTEIRKIVAVITRDSKSQLDSTLLLGGPISSRFG